jgi:hypothetical protein
MVIRYDPQYTDGPGAVMEEHPQGDYVDYDDYETLLDKYSDLQEKYAQLVDGLSDLYRNA